MAKKTKTKSRGMKSRNRYGMLLFLILFALLEISILYISAHHQHLENGQLAGSLTYTSLNPASNLDLRVASKATYPSAPLGVVKDVAVTNGIKEEIIDFSVKTDHLTEYGLLMMPAKPAPPQGFPALILCHGYMNPSRYVTTENYISDMSFYASHGFVVVKPDFRGQGLSAHQGHPEGAFFSMAYNTDVMSLISSLKQTHYIDKTRISIWGHSLGAYIALRAAVLSPDIKNTILLSGPVDSLTDMYLDYAPSSDENNPTSLLVRQAVFNKYGTPDQNTTFWNNASPINFVSHIVGHVQIYVGQKDSIVPPSFSADLDAALTSHKVPHSYTSYPDGNHELIPQRQEIWKNSLRLLQSNPPSAESNLKI